MLDCKKLRSLRKKAGMTRRDVERETGIDRALLARWETGGVANPGAYQLLMLADLYKVDPRELMTEKD